MTYVKSNGESFAGEAAVAAMQADYALFTDFFHEPTYGTVASNPDGSSYRLIGYAKMFVNLPAGAGGGGEKKYTDLQGRGWECQAQGAFIFDVVKDPAGPQGLRIKFFQMFADPTPILGEAIKRGIIPVEALTS